MIEFKEFPKISRFSRDIIVTEKIDGTNACICITEDEQFLTGSRTKWITPECDNYGFARWAQENKEELMKLGIGTHYGEWYGSGINRGYGLQNGEKRFALFNTSRWLIDRPKCCDVVPVLWQGNFQNLDVNEWIIYLKEYGSKAVLGYMKPEGIVIFHTAANICFKKTIEKDEMPKSKII